MALDRVFQLKISKELLAAVHRRSRNASEYIRSLILADLSNNPEPLAESVHVNQSKPPYLYYAKLSKAVDGDTLQMQIDLGFDVWTKVIVRLAKINAPPDTTTGGQAAIKFVEKELADTNIVVETKHKDPYGRHLAVIYYHPKYDKYADIMQYGRIINDQLISAGLAEKYDAG